jgi:hypothetical protein
MGEASCITVAWRIVPFLRVPIMVRVLIKIVCAVVFEVPVVLTPTIFNFNFVLIDIREFCDERMGRSEVGRGFSMAWRGGLGEV